MVRYLLPGHRRTAVSARGAGHRHLGGDRDRRPWHDARPRHRGADLGRDRQMTAPIHLVALDMAGTTVTDTGAVEEAFQVALDAVGITAGDLRHEPQAYIRRTMGQSKLAVFTEL